MKNLSINGFALLEFGYEKGRTDTINEILDVLRNINTDAADVIEYMFKGDLNGKDT